MLHMAGTINPIITQPITFLFKLFAILYIPYETKILINKDKRPIKIYAPGISITRAKIAEKNKGKYQHQ